MPCLAPPLARCYAWSSKLSCPTLRLLLYVLTTLTPITPQSQVQSRSSCQYTCASDYLAASVFAVPVAPLPAPTEDTGLGQRATSSEPPPSPTNGNAPHSYSVAVPVSFTVALDKAGSGTLPPALPVLHDSAEHPMGSDPQELSAVSQFSLACRPDQP